MRVISDNIPSIKEVFAKPNLGERSRTEYTVLYAPDRNEGAIAPEVS